MKKILLFLLTAALLMSASCGDTSVGDETTTAGGSDSPKTDSSSDSTTEVGDDLGDYDFGGKTFSIYTRTASIFYPYLDRQESSGDLVSDAIYERNRKIEERFSFKFEESYYDWSSTDGNDSPRKLLLAGDDTYDLYQGRNINMFNYASEGYFHKIDELTAIDTDKPYWNDQLYSDLAIGGAHYFAVGDFDISAYDFTHVMLFNKQMVEDLKLENPYELVKSGKWTFDKFAEMAKQAVADLDGNSVMDDKDQYGYTSLAKQVMPGFWIGGGAVTVRKNDAGELEFTAPTDQKFIDVCQKIFEITWDDNIWHQVPISVDKEEEMQLFCDGHSLFTNSSCFQIASIRDAATDFGILPYPKYDENQEKYYSRIEGCELFGVPLTNQNTEMASVILESMAAESMKSVVPAYYEIALKVKFTRDAESAEMLDIAFENRVFDYGDTLFCSELRDGVLRQAFAENNRNIVSTLTSVKNTVDAKAKSYNEAFASLK